MSYTAIRGSLLVTCRRLKSIQTGDSVIIIGQAEQTNPLPAKRQKHKTKYSGFDSSSSSILVPSNAFNWLLTAIRAEL